MGEKRMGEQSFFKFVNNLFRFLLFIDIAVIPLNVSISLYNNSVTWMKDKGYIWYCTTLQNIFYLCVIEIHNAQKIYLMLNMKTVVHVSDFLLFSNA